jgi:uncharacterized membrane protein
MAEQKKPNVLGMPVRAPAVPLLNPLAILLSCYRCVAEKWKFFNSHRSSASLSFSMLQLDCESASIGMRHQAMPLTSFLLTCYLYLALCHRLPEYVLSSHQS